MNWSSYEELLHQIPGFEFRPQQQEMIRAVEYALLEKNSLLAEAGTGVGKTFSYLLPILLQADRVEFPVILSTASINLQEQLIYKDLPFLLEVRQSELTFAIAKGRNNYISLRRFWESRDQLRLEVRSQQQMDRMEGEIRNGWDGDLGKLPFQPDHSLWQEVQSTNEDCLGPKCQMYAECCYKKARQELERAHLIVTNHHLYFMDYFYSNILPQHQFVILDEGHRLVEAATKVSAAEVRKTSFSYYLSRIHKKLTQKTPFGPVREIYDHEGRIYELLAGRKNTPAKWRPTPELDQSIEVLMKSLNTLEEWLKALAIHETDRPMNDLEVQNFDENKSNFAKQLKGLAMTWELFHSKNTGKEDVLWYELEERRENFILRATPLKIAEKLKNLWEEKSCIVTSATLSTSRNFEYFKTQTGVENAAELILESPFPYEQNALLYIPRVMPLLDSEPYQQYVQDEIEKLLNFSRGRALVLFTSIFRMKRAYQALTHRLSYPMKIQGDEPKQKLLEWFKEAENPVLFATASFWEGVDIPGEQLSCVIIDKIPFLTPDDPVVEARIDELKRQGKNWFMEYYLPDAATKLKQGFGRLIRTGTDKGVVAILDNRIWTKGYGKEIIESLPKARVTTTLEEVERFFSGSGF